ncbi:hypothetical protein BHE74_00003218 [Ensete ventricosum]|uniref:mRNA cap-binding protein n=1 Tax=Ensete ventricosum TaxID=4639 RepID=A0A427B302_ENSVE|nr:hypothetical protein B296_00002177 [Ensete ventricosum]RWW87919.1 hypothetical protein BHE74_00003218 [Ensete ventricosum]
MAETAASGGDEGGAPHRLERKWTFWFDNQTKPKQGAAWGTSLRKAYTFDTVEEFWWYGTGSPAPIYVFSVFAK